MVYSKKILLILLYFLHLRIGLLLRFDFFSVIAQRDFTWKLDDGEAGHGKSGDTFYIDLFCRVDSIVLYSFSIFFAYLGDLPK